MIRVALTMPRFVPFRSTDHHYLYTRLPQVEDYVPVTVRGHHSVIGSAAMTTRFVLRRAGLGWVDSAVFGSNVLMPVGRLPECDAVFSYGFFPRHEVNQPIVWEQTFGNPTWGSDALDYHRELRHHRCRAVERATRVVTATDYSAEQFRAAFPAHADKVTMVPYFLPNLGIVDEAFVRDKHQQRGPVEILFVGKQGKRKGLDTLAAALRHLPDDVSRQLRVTAVSALLDGPISLPHQVEHHVFVEDLAPLYQKAQLFIFPTKHEAFGLALVEAMATGCAVITTSNPLQRSIIGEAGGMFINPHDTNELAKTITEVVRDRDKLVAMGLANRQRAADVYAPAVVAASLHEELKKVLS